jgi:ferredoxin
VRIVIDTERCTGHGRCYSLAPDLFDCDDRGYGTVIDPEVPSGLEEQARTATLSCPENAIALEE